MRDPHIDWLSYRLECAPGRSFNNPPDVEEEFPAFDLTIHDAIAKFTLKEHHASLEEAQGSIAPFLRAWEIDIGLNLYPGEIRFVYESFGIIDRNPPQPGEAQVIRLQAVGSLSFSGTATPSISRSAYPQPPFSFTITPTVETLWQRYEGYVSGREPLSSMAYFCLTVIESTVGKKSKRRAAATRYQISLEVLDTLGKLTEHRGDSMTARKMDTNLISHTAREVQWIEEAVKKMIRQVAEVGAGGTVKQIGMGDLPDL